MRREGSEWLDWDVRDGLLPLCEFLGRQMPKGDSVPGCDAFWQRRLARDVQQRWAATFHDNEMARELLSSQQPTVTFTLWTYIPMFVAACIFLCSAWLSPAQRSTYTWIAVALSIEPAIRLDLMKFRSTRQHPEATGCTELLPFRPNIAASIGVILLIPPICLALKKLSTPILVPEGLPTSNLQREAEIQRIQAEIRRLEVEVAQHAQRAP